MTGFTSFSPAQIFQATAVERLLMNVRNIPVCYLSDLNRKKIYKPGRFVKWSLTELQGGEEDSNNFFSSPTINPDSPKILSSITSFDDVYGIKQGPDDIWPSTFKSRELKSKGLFSLSESTANVKRQKNKLRFFLEENLVRTKEIEIILPPDLIIISQNAIDMTVKQLGLHWQSYGTKGSEVKLVSKFPLARYRPEFDPRTKIRHPIDIDDDVLDTLQLTLNTLKINSYEEDWTTDPSEQDSKDLSPNRATIEAQEDIYTDERSTISDEQESLINSELKTVVYRHQALHDMSSEEIDEIRQRYESFLASHDGQSMMFTRQSLPSWNKRTEILETIRKNQVVIISGETGCGKTTQVPQFILQEAIESGRMPATNIICTQPRRISAMSVSQRVAYEMGEKLGELVGYQVRMSARRSPNTRLLFCTSGILLRRLISDRGLEDVSHIIVDEIHERGMNEDFILIALRNVLAKRPDLKVVLMSASLDAKTFSAYFSNAPAIPIEGTMYPVKELFLEDVLEKTNFTISAMDKQMEKKYQWYQKAKSLTENPAMLDYNPKKSAFIGYKESTFTSIRTWASCSNEKLHYGLIEAAVEQICSQEEAGGVLVFVTGWDDIQSMMDILKTNLIVGNTSRVKLLPLHSSLESVSQEEIFNTPPEGVRKVVLATNIAETSITINDIVYVVDGGKAKEKSYDALNKIACLFPTWISKASCTQRKGRAGRVRPGYVYRLYPRAMYEECFSDHQLPEIMRTPLAELCLQIKSLGLGSVQEFLASAINPPSPRTVHNAVSQLKSIGAINAKQELTPLGKHLAHIPVEPSLGKMLLMGAVFGCLDPCLTLAAASTVKDPFLRPISYRKEVDAIRLSLAAGTCSDHMALLRAFEGYRDARCRGGIVRWNYCRENFLNGQSFQQIDQMRIHFAEFLADIGYLKVGALETDGGWKPPSGRYNIWELEEAIFEHSKNSGMLELLRGVLCSGMFPNIALVTNGKKRPSFLTLEDGSVRPHLQSVNGASRFFPHRWMVYTDKVNTGGILVRNSTMITDMALLLFGGDVEVDESDPSRFSILEGKLLFSAKAEIAQVIMALQKELQSLLERKIREPRIDIFDEGGSTIGAVMTLLANERQAYLMNDDYGKSEAIDEENF